MHVVSIGRFLIYQKVEIDIRSRFKFIDTNFMEHHMTGCKLYLQNQWQKIFGGMYAEFYWIVPQFYV